MLQQRLGMSQRRACRAISQPRSTQRYQPLSPDAAAALRAWLRQFSTARPRWATGARTSRRAAPAIASTARRSSGCGARKAYACRRSDASANGWAPRRCRPTGAPPSGPTRCGPPTSSSTPPPTGGWSRSSTFVDEHTREALACHVARRIDTDATVDALEGIAAVRGYPEFIRCDNGPELTAHAIRDWCRASGAGTAYIDPGSPWQNPYVESFNARLRDELLAVEQFDTILEAKVLVDDWRIDYNLNRPHSSLGYLTPAAYAATQTQPPLS